MFTVQKYTYHLHVHINTVWISMVTRKVHYVNTDKKIVDKIH